MTKKNNEQISKHSKNAAILITRTCALLTIHGTIYFCLYFNSSEAKIMTLVTDSLKNAINYRFQSRRAHSLFSVSSLKVNICHVTGKSTCRTHTSPH